MFSWSWELQGYTSKFIIIYYYFKIRVVESNLWAMYWITSVKIDQQIQKFSILCGKTKIKVVVKITFNKNYYSCPDEILYAFWCDIFYCTIECLICVKNILKLAFLFMKFFLYCYFWKCDWYVSTIWRCNRKCHIETQ